MKALNEGSEKGAKTVPAYDVVKLRLACLEILPDSRQGYEQEHIGQNVKEKLKKDPFFGPLSGSPQSLGFMMFVRNTCLELCRTVEHVNEIAEKHKDRAHCSRAAAETDTETELGCYDQDESSPNFCVLSSK